MLMTLIHIIDYIFYVALSFSCLYLLFFSILSMKRNSKIYGQETPLRRYLVLFPAYKEDAVIFSSAESFLKQSYQKEYYDVIVLSDKMRAETNKALRELDIEVLEVHFEQSSKAKTLAYAMEIYGNHPYDAVIIMDADNIVNTDFLSSVTCAYNSGYKAIQAHRTAKNTDTSISILDGVSEEINNSIFRKGFSRVGLSATLSGSGMVFDFDWFKNHIHLSSSSGEDKEFEAMLLKEGIHIEYLENVLVYDEKISQTGTFYNQRRRWLAAQYGTLMSCLKDIPSALSSGNMDYLNKILQWMMLPRIMLIGLVCLFTFAWSIGNVIVSAKWWILLFILSLALLLAIPRKLYNASLLKALWRIPVLFFLMLFNFFRLRGAYKNFIHTKHKEDSSSENK